MMMSSLKYLWIIVIFFISINQLSAQHRFDKNYFQSPLNIPLSLAGNFGECRPNHFHTGLDFKTNQKENLPVLAAADGYVSRMVLSHTGYGHTLYINHPNGLQTVYAHLNDFNPTLMNYLRQAQYRLEQWNVDITIPADSLPVKKGEQIAFSGNTGGSMAPHLHFEIRIAGTDTVLNAALFHFPIQDNTAPIIKSLAIYDADKSLYNQVPIIIPIQHKEGVNTLAKPIEVPFSKAYFGIYTDDMMPGSTNVLGIYQMELKQDGATVIKTTLDALTFGLNRYMNAYGDFRRFKEKGIWYQLLYKMPRNNLPVYTNEGGSIELTDKASDISIAVADVYQNTSTLKVTLIGTNTSSDNMKCSAPAAWQAGHIALDDIQFTFSPNWMYDGYCWDVRALPQTKYGASVQLAYNFVPIHDYGLLKLKLKNPLPFQLRSKLIFQYEAKQDKLPGTNAQNGMAATFDNGWATARIRNLGNYSVGVDTIAPKVMFNFKKNQSISKGQYISFSVTESQTSIAQCNPYIDDTWEPFTRSKNTFSYKIPANMARGSHTLKVIVSDENANERVETITFLVP